MWVHWGLRLFVFSIVVARLGCSAAISRDYVTGSWSRRFYRPRGIHVDSVGLVNEDTAFFATRKSISAFHRGLLTNVIEVADADITAFHLCHHRSSLLYEEASSEGGAMSVFEYSLITMHKAKVAEFQDTAPALSLACVDRLLLRASRANLLAVQLRGGAVSVLREFLPEAPDAIVSLAVRYAADVYAAAEIYAVEASNSTVFRLRLAHDGDRLRVRGGPLLAGGPGGDGPLGSATALRPHHVLWSHGRLLFADGCSVRQLRDGHVSTLLGVPAKCAEPGNESLEPVPWASVLARPMALASTAEGTATGAVLVLTGAGIVHMVQRGNACAGNHVMVDCAAQADCGWAEDPRSGQRQCFDCAGLREWAGGERPAVDACSLEGAPPGGTKYSLAGCGCVAPAPSPDPSPEPPPGPGVVETSGMAVAHTLLALLVTIAMVVAVVLLYRKHRRAAVMHELYGADTAEFHTFSDDPYAR